MTATACRLRPGRTSPRPGQPPKPGDGAAPDQATGRAPSPAPLLARTVIRVRRARATWRRPWWWPTATARPRLATCGALA